MPLFTIRFFGTTRLLAASILFWSAAEAAHAGPYGTLGVSVEDIQAEDDFDSFTGTGINARLGYNFGRYFGVEAEGQIGLSGEGDNPYFIDGTLIQNETYDYSGAWALYLRPQLPVSDNFSLSVRAGFGVKYFDRTVDNFEFPSGARESQFNDTASLLHGALGAGVEYSFGELNTQSVRLDFTRRYDPGSLSDGDDEGTEDSQVTVSYVRKF